MEEPVYDEVIVMAIKSFARGSATDGQQMAVFHWLIEEASGLFKMSYVPGEDGRRATDFHEGRRFVGRLLLNLANIPVRKFRGEQLRQQDDSKA